MGSHLPNYLRRTDSKDSSCSSMSSSQHRDLGTSMSMPAHFHKQFKRTDSSDSNTSSLASFGLGFLSRNGSKKKGPAPHATAHHQVMEKINEVHSLVPITRNGSIESLVYQLDHYLILKHF